MKRCTGYLKNKLFMTGLTSPPHDENRLLHPRKAGFHIVYFHGKFILTAWAIAALMITGGCVTHRNITKLSREHQQLMKETGDLRADLKKPEQLQKDLDEIKRLIEDKPVENEKRQTRNFRNLQNNIADVKYKQEEFASELAVIKENQDDNRRINSKILKKLETIEGNLLKEIKKLKFKRRNPPSTGHPGTGK